MVNVYVKLNSKDAGGSNFPHCISVDNPSDFNVVMNYLNTVNAHPGCDGVEYHTSVEGSYVSQEELKLLEENAELLDINLVYEEFTYESEI